MGHEANPERRKHHRANGKRKYPRQMPPETAQRGEICPIHQQRREEEHQDQRGIELERRELGHECESAATDEQRCGRGQAYTSCRPMQGDNDGEQNQYEFKYLDRMH
ncbi:hypothetical protein DYGSA30_36330 [Dyella sp. GSA-30]|nr:hypothetical protein DYGSA30_36330 [Dyella sp. GSA-30]